jgi:hypothetical protein
MWVFSHPTSALPVCPPYLYKILKPNFSLESPNFLSFLKKLCTVGVPLLLQTMFIERLIKFLASVLTNDIFPNIR